MIKKDDFIDIYVKLRQRGFAFLRSKLSLNPLNRTRSAFNDEELIASNWWIIPAIRRRWNLLVTGNEGKRYEDYLVDQYLKDKQNLKMLSLGSGISSHEIYLAQFDCFEQIKCVDISDRLLQEAERIATEKGLRNISFTASSIYDMTFETEAFDIIFFNASLHHFKNIESLIVDYLLPALKTNGLIVINEYVGPNRMQFPIFISI